MMICKQREWDSYFSEMVCRRYGMACRVCCCSCDRPEWVEDRVV